MHNHFSTYYEIDKHYREEELQRKLEKKYWREQAKSKLCRKRRPWHIIISLVIGFFS